MLQAFQDVEDALVAFSQRAGDAAPSSQEAVRANQRAAELARRSYGQGLTDFLTVLVAEQSVFTSQDTLAQTERDVALQLVALYKAVGGGWRPGPTPPPPLVPLALGAASLPRRPSPRAAARGARCVTQPRRLQLKMHYPRPRFRGRVRAFAVSGAEAGSSVGSGWAMPSRRFFDSEKLANQHPEDPSVDMKQDTSFPLDMTAGMLQEGHAWVLKVPAMFGRGDAPDAPTASRLVLYEDDRELGPSHAQHETIRQIGRGAYSHWNDTLYFSTSDRSDPRRNGRTYRLALRSLKVVVIGLDGTDPQTLRRHIAAGRLPAIAKILEQSREVELRSEGELFINSFWPCFASGLSVGSHGVHAFRPLRSGTMQLVERQQYRVTTPFWETAARSGVRTCVLDATFYGPPAARSGLEKLSYVEWGPHPPARPPGSLSPNLIKHLLSRHGPHPCPIDVESLRTVQDSADMAALLCIGARKRAAVINDLIQMTNPELFVAMFPELHTAGHQWLHKETPDHQCYDAELVSTLGSPIRQVYEAVDHAIGEVIRRLPPETTVVLTCLGGVRVTHGGAYLLHDLLARLGLSVAGRYEDQPQPRRHLLEPIRVALRRCREIWSGHRPFEHPPGLYFDWSKTRAFALPWAYDGYLRINQQRREPLGIVAPGAEREQVLAEIERAVHSLRLAGTDEPAAKAVVRTQEAFPGAASAELPDLMVLWNSGRPFDAIESASIGRIENRDPAGRSAHIAEGGMFAYGPLIAAGPTVRGARDFDVAPTVLALFGIENAGPCDGRAISELIASGRPPRAEQREHKPAAART